MDRPVTRARHQNLLSIDHGDGWSAVGCIFGQRTRACDPNQFARCLIKRHESVSRTSGLVPTGRDTADDDEIFKHDGRVCPSAIRA